MFKTKYIRINAYYGSNGYWYKNKFDVEDNEIYYEDSRDRWRKYEYDSNNHLIYCEDHTGYIIDKRKLC